MFEQDFIDFIELLNKNEVEYMVIGAHALAFHGRPRHTGDLDIWINPANENAEKMLEVIAEFGFASLGLKKEDFLNDNCVTQLGYPPLRIDILNAISGVQFEEAFNNKINADVDGLLINFINVDDFIANKQASGRKKDLGDIEALKRKKLNPPSPKP